MKVLQLVNSLNIGGLERVVIHLVKNHSDLKQVDYSIACLEEKGILAHEIEGQVKIYELGKLSYSYFHLIRELIRIILKEKIEIIHCHNYAPLLFSVIVKILLLGKIKVLYTEHNQIYRIDKRHLYMFRILIKMVDKQIAVSHDLRKYFIRTGISKRFEVVWNGIPAPQVNKNRVTQIKNELNIKPDKFIIGTAVVMSEQKGISYLIEAARLLVPKYEQFHFLLVGDGPLRKTIEEKIKYEELSDYFTLPGYRSDAVNYLMNMDLFVLPSLWEGFSIVLLECNALGLPIVATQVGGNAEIIHHQENGILVPAKNPRALAEAIEKVYLDASLRNTLKKNAKMMFLKYFTIEKMVTQYLQKYTELLK